MLVDLGRNDLGRVSEIGSVRVTELMDVRRYSYVMHIEELGGRAPRAGRRASDALRATPSPPGPCRARPRFARWRSSTSSSRPSVTPTAAPSAGWAGTAASTPASRSAPSCAATRGRPRAGGRRDRGRLGAGHRVRGDPEQGGGALPGHRGRGRPGGLVTKVVLIDNYDGFTYNLVQYLGELGAEVEVHRRRHRRRRVERAPTHLVVSPGFKTPDEAGISVDMHPWPAARCRSSASASGTGRSARPSGRGSCAARSRSTGRPAPSSTTAARCSPGSRPRWSRPATTRSWSTPTSPPTSSCRHGATATW